MRAAQARLLRDDNNIVDDIVNNPEWAYVRPTRTAGLKARDRSEQGGNGMTRRARNPSGGSRERIEPPPLQTNKAAANSSSRPAAHWLPGLSAQCRSVVTLPKPSTLARSIPPPAAWRRSAPAASPRQSLRSRCNEAGGIKSLGGAKLNLIISDVQSDTTVTRTETDRLITGNKLSAVHGCFASALTLIARRSLRTCQGADCAAPISPSRPSRPLRR